MTGRESHLPELRLKAWTGFGQEWKRESNSPWWMCWTGTTSKDQVEPDGTNKDVMASDQAGSPSKSGNRRLPEPQAAWKGHGS